jgi:ferric enterobactin receptor
LLVNIFLMNRVLAFIIINLLAVNVQGQIFKKHPPKVPSILDKIRINEHFRAETLDTVYNTLHQRYGLNIVYDTAYCSTVVFSYWYTGTPAPLALEITTRNNDLYCVTDSLNVVHIKAKHPHKITLPKAVNTAADRKYMYVPVNTSFTLKGYIADDSTGEPVANAIILVEHTSIVATTNTEGAYVLPDVPADTMMLAITATGYAEKRLRLNQGMNKDELVIGLDPDLKVLEEAVITGKKDELFKMNNAQVSAIKLTPAKLAEIPNVGEKDIMRTFQLMPGISAANESSSGLYVRGGTPDQNLVMYDGFTVYQVDHLYGFFSAFNANAVKEVTLYKGGFDARYGGRLSSVTDMTGKEGSTKQFNIGGDLSLLSMNLFTEVPVTDNLSVVAAVRKSWQGPIYDWIFNSFNRNSEASQPSGGGPGGADGVTKARSYFYDVNTRVTFRPTKKDIFYYSFFNGGDDLNNSFTINTPPFLAARGISLNFGTTDVTKYGNTGMSLAWLRKWSKSVNSNTTVSYSNYVSSRDRVTTGSVFRPGDTSTTKTGVFENNNLKDLSLRSDWELDLAKWNQVGVGMFGTKYGITYSYSHNDTALLLNRDNPGLLAGVYLQDKLSFFNNKITVTPGVRVSYFDVTNKTYTEPRVSFNYNITKKLSLKGAYGQYYQFANRITREDISAGSSQFWVLADGSSVPVSSATHYIAGLSYEHKGYTFGIEGYYKQLYDLSQFTERNVANSSSINYETAFYTGNGYSRGLEIMAQKSAGKFTGWVSYTLATTMYHFPVYSSGWFPADQDVNHEVKIVGMYKHKRWDFAATWIYASGKPYTAPGGTYSVTLLDGSTQNYFTTTSKNTLRLPDYHRMDVSVNYHFYSEKKKDIGYVGISLFNVYARNNVWYKQFTVVDNTVIETNVNYLSFTPNVTLSLKMR